MVQPYPTPKPSGGTAAFAAVVSWAVGLWYLVGVLMHGWVGPVILYVEKVAGLLLAVLLILGGILLLSRRPAGRLLCVIGAVLALVFRVVTTVLDLLPPTGLFFSPGGPLPGTGLPWQASRIVWSLPAIVILVFALLPATRRWTRRTVAFPPYPPQVRYPYPPGTHPQYPQQQPYQQGGRPPGW